MSRYIIAGGSGFVGKQLTTYLLEQGHTVYVLTRNKTHHTVESSAATYVHWNPDERVIDMSHISKEPCTIINLAGAGVADKRWTHKQKKIILSSRIESLNTLYTYCKKGDIVATKLVSASAIGYYGEGDDYFTETHNGDSSYLSCVCKQWEHAACEFYNLNIDVAIARIGIVLGQQGGALPKLVAPLKFRLAAIPGSGKQIYSWIHIDDLVRLLAFLSQSDMRGVYNAVAPIPCSVNSLFSELKKFFPALLTIHAPSWLLKILLGEMSVEVLKSATVSSKKIQGAEFRFIHEDISTCVKAIYSNTNC